MNKKRKKNLLAIVWKYLIFFLLMAFIITNCMLLFLGQLEKAMGISIYAGNVKTAAALTFGNVLLLSMLCTVVDGVRRKYMVDRPVKQIIRAAERIMQGDFDVRIAPYNSPDMSDGFQEIIEYFNKMAEELSGIETLRTDFIANVSHELKTPLAVMQNYGTMLQQPGLPEEKRMEYAKAVVQASRRLADLVTNILKLNKLENQQIYPKAEEYDLSEQICRSLLQFEPVWEKKKIDIETDLEENVSVSADPELLSIVWNNLFSNAFKFTPEGGRVSVSLSSDNGAAVMTVADTGCGMSAETGAHIFEKFYQGDTSHSVQGNGLGLALVKRIIEIVGGNISVKSEAGKGSIFEVRIRRHTDEKMEEDM